MKTNRIIFSIFTVFTTIVIIGACSEKDLELVNPNQLSPETFFTTNAQVTSAVNAVYTNLQTIPLFTRAYFFMHDLMGGDAQGNPQLEADKVQYYNFSFDASHGDMSGYWNSCYRGINKANFVIGNQEKINSLITMNQTTKDKYIGEAKFMRAFYNFLLVIRYGDIPLLSEIPTSSEGKPKSPKAEVYALIESDLQDASAVLLDKSVEANGRANKQAAIALLGKVYLYQEKYDLALAEFVKLNGQFTLEDDYFDNFMDETEHGPESIFEIEYDQTLGANGLWGAGNAGSGANESTLRGQEYGWNDWFNTYPADDLLAEYEVDDKRFEETFYTDGDLFEGDPDQRTIRTGVAPSPVPATEIYIPLQRQAAWRKYQNYYKRRNENIDSSINMKYMRYADVLLMMAECENKRPGGNQLAAKGYIDQVRARAGLLPTTAVTQAQIFEAIVHERRVELAGEQSRFSDLIRWGRAATELSGQGFASRNVLWPIPANEFSTNKSLTPADQNPGY
ncbi:RagB/SusD family nutrient uptake outer membrane protein [Confluentibacter lentus]|uniref:RagB/SusD family nutrient uptake outer membrane protein n=1 Tax=Confluentibacter lentus TaxID=1699412 RepID=UPI000C28E20B|nr:RagB/SusD family nutrient uptake outer membrane protein [Confluentibacter lentus]